MVESSREMQQVEFQQNQLEGSPVIFKDDNNGIVIDLQTNDKIQKAKEMNGRYNRSLGSKGLSIESLGMKSRSVNGYLKFKKK